MDIDEAREFLKDNHRAVLATRKRSGDLQMSPVVVGIDAEGRAVISATETRAKVINLRRDPRASLCVMNDRFFGRWVQVDGQAEIVSLPEAMPLLVETYRLVSGEHPDWEEYREAMERDRRCVIRIAVDHAGP
jgi:PPOX class probable F420-dependent enzyme